MIGGYKTRGVVSGGVTTKLPLFLNHRNDGGVVILARMKKYSLKYIFSSCGIGEVHLKLGDWF